MVIPARLSEGNDECSISGGFWGGFFFGGIQWDSKGESEDQSFERNLFP
jgi:hypothetical protein